MSSVGLILLAAGNSSRMNGSGSKQLLEYDGLSLLRRSVLAAELSKCGPVIAVLGFRATAMSRELIGTRCETVMNLDWHSGIGSSIQAGIAALRNHAMQCDAAIIMGCDQPFVTTAHLNEMVAAYDAVHTPIVASQYDGVVGIPALFSKELFDELVHLPAGIGAKSIIEQRMGDVTKVPLEKGHVDVDTMESYAALLALGGLTPGQAELAYVHAV